MNPAKNPRQDLFSIVNGSLRVQEMPCYYAKHKTSLYLLQPDTRLHPKPVLMLSFLILILALFSRLYLSIAKDIWP
jgi:hypothetical protein